MAEQGESESPIVKLALEKKLVSQKQVEQCVELVKKSNKIGLAATVEEVMAKQGVLTEDQLQDLRDMCQMADGGTVFGTYRLGRLIGQGGMGKVYEAVHETMGRSIAIKVVSTKFTEDKNNTVRFYQEIRALAKLNHPNIVIIFDAGRVNRRHYFAMELLSGLSLKAFVDSKTFLEEKEALQIVRATAKALGHAHARNVVHRDVKPENIIFDANKVPKLTDFGLVMHYDTDHLTLTQEGMMVGSFHYASPEQVDGLRDIDGRSDIYSLGATLYYALTGHTVYTGGSPQELLAKHLKGRYTTPRKYNPRISGKTVRLLRKMLTVNRDKRFQSMEEVVAAIERPSLSNKIIIAAAAVLASAWLLIMGMFLQRIFHVF
jgi:eukaryotic-like serine/threonine-protein kinase